MKKIIVFLCLIIAMGFTISHLYAEKPFCKDKNHKQNIKTENPIKEVEILDYEISSKPYQYSTMERRSRLFKFLHQATGIINFVLIIAVGVLGLFVSGKPAIKSIFIITVIILFINALSHLYLDLIFW